MTAASSNAATRTAAAVAAALRDVLHTEIARLSARFMNGDHGSTGSAGPV